MNLKYGTLFPSGLWKHGVRDLSLVLSTTNSVPKEFLATGFEAFSLAFIPKVIATLNGSFSRILFGESRSGIILDGFFCLDRKTRVMEQSLGLLFDFAWYFSCPSFAGEFMPYEPLYRFPLFGFIGH